MKKKIALVTESIQSGQVYKEWLDEFFGELIEVEEYSLEKGDYVRIPDADLYIVGASSTQAYDQVIALIQPDKNIVVPALTFSKEQVSKLKVLPGGRRAMLVNLSANMAIETIAELNRLGVTQLDLVPVYPGIGQLPDTELAISPGEGRYVPDKAKQVIELGPRTFTSGTLAEIALKLGFSWFIKEKVYRDYVESLADPGGSLVTLWSQSMRMENYLEILMGMMDTGILGVDMEDRIFAVNSVAQDILSLKQKDCIGRSLTWAAPQLCRQISPEERKRKISKLIKLAETPISIATAPIDWEGKPVGCFIMLQRFTEEEDRQQQFRLQLYRRGHHSKYVFDDIICSCPSMQRAKNIAFKMALTDSSILLTGESGTGKELFAHSIHNASRRSAMPFVALNCAALPENLLESELFGYGEGAFTGAKKGGKIGLFEYAHRGTLFLDEIEGMSKNLQVKLLRVLQEKEIMRIGDNRVIAIDVRIIAASNENILERVKEGTFRKDLYYRLNTLPIEIPPLREREEDVFLISGSIIKRLGADFQLSDGARQVFQNYSWDGNVRELSNILEYLCFLDKPLIGVEDLPAYMLTENRTARGDEEDGDDGRAALRQAAAGREETFEAILRSLGQVEEGGLGRKALRQRLAEQGICAGEQEIRGVLHKLHCLGLISVSRGRGGSRLTRKGRELTFRSGDEGDLVSGTGLRK